MKHLEELFEMYPCLKLLTGDAIYAQRPLLEPQQYSDGKTKLVDGLGDDAVRMNKNDQMRMRDGII